MTSTPIPSTDTSLAGSHLLIADSKPERRQQIATYGQVWEMQVTALSSGSEVLQWVSAGGNCDLVLLDQHLPDLDGMLVARVLREVPAFAQTPLVLITAGTPFPEQDEQQLFAAVLNDPVSQPQLQTTLSRLLKEAANMSAFAPQPAEEVIDWSFLRDLLAALDEQGSALLATVRAELNGQITRLEAAGKANDRGLIRQISHQLRGGSRQIGAVALAACCNSLEAVAHTESVELLLERIAGIRCAYEEVFTLLAVQGWTT